MRLLKQVSGVKLNKRCSAPNADGMDWNMGMSRTRPERWLAARLDLYLYGGWSKPWHPG